MENFCISRTTHREWHYSEWPNRSLIEKESERKRVREIATATKTKDNGNIILCSLDDKKEIDRHTRRKKERKFDLLETILQYENFLISGNRKKHQSLRGDMADSSRQLLFVPKDKCRKITSSHKMKRHERQRESRDKQTKNSCGAITASAHKSHTYLCRQRIFLFSCKMFIPFHFGSERNTGRA